MRAVCPTCRRLVGAHVPAGGDGSAAKVRRHLDLRGHDLTTCRGSAALVDLAATVTS